MLIDTHCHLYFDAFSGREAQVATAMRSAGVGGALVVGIDADSNRKAAGLVVCAREETWPVRLEYSAGLHPAEPFDPALFNLPLHLAMARLLAPQLEGAQRPIAIGECGIDLYWKKNPLNLQQAVFAAQLELGRALDLPVIVHTRQADAETLAVIESVPGCFGIMHCFNGSSAMVDFVLADRSRGGRWYASFAGNLTLGSRRLEAAAQLLPLDRILLETDAPFMAPAAVRARLPAGARAESEPADLRHTFEHLCRLRGIPAAEMEDTLLANARACFGVNWELT